jgi:hypothetical protein
VLLATGDAYIMHHDHATAERRPPTLQSRQCDSWESQLRVPVAQPPCSDRSFCPLPTIMCLRLPDELLLASTDNDSQNIARLSLPLVSVCRQWNVSAMFVCDMTSPYLQLDRSSFPLFCIET